MKGLRQLLNEKRAEAKALMQSDDSRDKHEALGMMSVVTELSAWVSKQKKTERFLTKDNTIVKDGFLYARMNDVPINRLK